MSQPSDRRECERLPGNDIWLEIEIKSSHHTDGSNPSRAIKAKVENLSDGGMCIISPEPFELGQEVNIIASNLPSKGIIAWTCQSRIECKAGIQFT